MQLLCQYLTLDKPSLVYPVLCEKHTNLPALHDVCKINIASLCLPQRFWAFRITHRMFKDKELYKCVLCKKLAGRNEGLQEAFSQHNFLFITITCLPDSARCCSNTWFASLVRWNQPHLSVISKPQENNMVVLDLSQ